MMKKIVLASIVVFSLLFILSRYANVQLGDAELLNETEAIEQNLKASRIQVLFKTVPSKVQLEKFRKSVGALELSQFSPFKSRFFSRLFDVKVNKKSTIRKIKKHPLVEGVHIPKVVKPTAVYPTKQARNATNDQFYAFQWALENVYVPGDEDAVDYPDYAQGHLLRVDLDQVSSSFLSSRPLDGSNETYSIGYGPESLSYASYGDGDSTVKVAVIDSGVDYFHDDLKANMAWKEEECDSRRNNFYPGRPRNDVDGNGFDGDCLGWNFTVETNSNKRNKPLDGFSHGTHISGILAAHRNNEIGVAGVSDRIRVLPIKVLRGSGEEYLGQDGEEVEEDEDQPLGEKIGFTDSVAKAILYAVEEEAAVINMSLGWPRILDVDIIREAIQEALSRNVTIVVAAGNDGHASQLVPCSLKGVICVGAIRNDGSVASFSNHGGHVDVLAPGFGILSTFPIGGRNFPELFRFSRGHEIMAGTSMAAPYVSAAAAIMKLKEPSTPNSEILARLLLSSRAVYDQTETAMPVPSIRAQGGTLQLEKFLQQPKKGLAYLDLKQFGLVRYNSATKSASHELKLQGLWDNSTNVNVSVRSLNDEISVTASNTSHAQLLAGQELPVQLNFSFSDIQADSVVQLIFTVSQDGLEDRQVWHEVMLARDLEGDQVVTHTLPELPAESLGLRHVSYPLGNEQKPSFFSMSVTEDASNLILYQLGENGIQQIGQREIPFLFRRFQNLPGPQEEVYSLDLDDDGVNDYLVLAIVQDAEANNYFQFSYLKSDFTPMYSGQSDFRLPVRDVEVRWNVMRLVTTQVSGIGRIKLPVLMTRGRQPDEDLPSVFEFAPEGSVTTDVFYLEMAREGGEHVLKHRLLTNHTFKTTLQRRLNLRDVDRLELVSSLSQSESDLRNGKMHLIYAYDNIGDNKAAIVTLDARVFNSRSTFNARVVEGRLDLSDVVTLPVTDISSNVRENTAFSYNVMDYRSRLTNRFSLPNQLTKLGPGMEFQTDQSVGILDKVIASYQKDDTSIAILKGDKAIVAMLKGRSGPQVTMKRKLVKSSFLPGFFFAELFYPTVVKNQAGRFDAGLFIDATAILARNIMVWQVEENAAKVPLHFNVMIPDNCLTVDQVRWNAEGVRALALLCQNEDESQKRLVFYPFTY